jgi:hypothetical protein
MEAEYSSDTLIQPTTQHVSSQEVSGKMFNMIKTLNLRVKL